MASQPISLQLEAFVPERCAGCNTASEVCFVIARQVMQGQISIEDAGAEVTETISQNCLGEIERSSGWASLSKSCRYIEQSEITV